MKMPVDIRFVGLEPSGALEAAVRDRVRRIDGQYPDTMAWRITVEQEHKHQHQGRPFSVRIDLTLRGDELVVDRVEREDPYVALRDAFDAMRRQLQEAMRIRRGEVKQHAAASPGEQP